MLYTSLYQFAMIILLCLYMPLDAAKTLPSSNIKNLHDITLTIIDAIKHDTLQSYLPWFSEESLAFLIKNYSPANLGFTIEVLEQEKPVMLYCAHESMIGYQEFKALLKECAQRFLDELVCIEVDSKELLSIAKLLHAHDAPTFIFLHNGLVITQIKSLPTPHSLYEYLEDLIDQAHLIQ